MKKIFLLIIVSLGNYCLSYGQGTTGAQFLKLSYGARPSALGEAFVGVSDDINAVYWNPAGLANLKNPEASFNGALLYESIYYGSIQGAERLFQGTAAISFVYLGMDEMKGYDNAGNSISDYTADDKCLGVSYGRNLGDKTSLGGTIKIIKQSIEKEDTNSAFAMDIGGMYTLDKKTKLGFVIQNFGTKIGFNEKFSLPTTARLGIGYKLNDNLLLLSDLNSPTDCTPSLHLGAEYTYDALAFRLGVKTKGVNDLGWTAALSAGIGIKIKRITFDYAILPYGDLGLTHRVSLILRWDEKDFSK
ncbi:MAG: PorV/PorQ family protein [Elusimicrobia bacterium]|nr:PorV/PorQ family protein [Patescibacteria group bacterium]MCG2726921.1 PorV/PorQ family protein [Elusimicrobiota bacterium]